MCGLAGFLEPAGLGNDAEERVRRMIRALRHRGPDDEGTWLDAPGGVALGARRLSIIDLSPLGHMPMVSPGGRYVIAYNGELYNFTELRRELEAAGVRFRGRSDTEVLLAAIERWGLDEALRRSVGMFAFALWDREARTLVLCRDRIGEKPLYWGRFGERVLFGSELKALRQHPHWHGHLDRGALALFLRLGFIPGPHTIYSGVRKVSPGRYLSFRAGLLEPVETRYWSPGDVAARAASEEEGDLDAWSDRMEQALRRSVRAQLVADVPVGAFLSGGIDSSLITALAQRESAAPVRTFTIGFQDEKFDESRYARAVARHLGTDHTELILSEAETLATVPRLHEVYDEPFADVSQIPTLLVSKLARSKVTVCLSGDGGDELFAGYTRYHWGFAAQKTLERLPRAVKQLAAACVGAAPVGFWNLAARVAAPLLPARLQAPEFEPKLRTVGAMLAAPTPQAFYLTQMSLWHAPARVVSGALEPTTAYTDPASWLGEQHPVARLMYLDHLTYLPDDILVKVDRASMAESLELRAPFLDHRVVELAWQVPMRFKLVDGGGKRILKHLLARFVPGELTERPKQGFGVPIGAWLRGALRPWAEDLLAERRLAADGVLEREPVHRLWQRHLLGEEDHGTALWHVLMFQQWLSHSR